MGNKDLSNTDKTTPAAQDKQAAPDAQPAEQNSQEKPAQAQTAADKEADTGKAAEKNATKAKPDHDKPASASPGEAETQPKPAKPGHKLAGAALVLAIIGLGGNGYLYWQNMQQTQARQSAVQSQAQALQAELDQARNQLQQNLNSLKETNQSTLQSLTQQQESFKNEVSRTLQRFNAQQRTSDREWRLAEAEYLLRLANQRILMEQTAKGALALLKSADEILRAADDAALYPVRKALAEDIAALEAVPKIDSEGVFLQLGALAGQIDKLPRLPKHADAPSPEAAVMEAARQADNWQTKLAGAWNAAVDGLAKLIVIQQHDKPVEPLLTPQQNFYLQQNLRLMLEQAQQALLARQPQSYQSALNKAHDWVSRYFDTQQAAVASLQDNLSALKTLEIAPQLPDISGSLNQLKAYQAARLKQQTQTPAPASNTEEASQ